MDIVKVLTVQRNLMGRATAPEPPGHYPRHHSQISAKLRRKKGISPNKFLMDFSMSPFPSKHSIRKTP